MNRSKSAGIFRQIGDKPPMDWFGMGCFAQGYFPRLLSHAEFSQNDDFDLVAVGGNLRRYGGANGAIFEYYRSTNTPVFVIETGRNYFYKLGPHWFLYLNKVPMLPESGDHDRSRAIFPKPKTKPRGEDILVIGQTRDFDKDMERNVVPKIKNFTNRKVVFRPRRGHSPPNCMAEFCEISTERDPSVDLDRAFAVVTHSSNMGGEALARGVPVFCDPIATFAGVGKSSFEEIDCAPAPDIAEVEDYFSRLACVCWSDIELRHGDGIKWFLENTQFLHAQAQDQTLLDFAVDTFTNKREDQTFG